LLPKAHLLRARRHLWQLALRSARRAEIGERHRADARPSIALPSQAGGRADVWRTTAGLRKVAERSRGHMHLRRPHLQPPAEQQRLSNRELRQEGVVLPARGETNRKTDRRNRCKVLYQLSGRGDEGGDSRPTHREARQRRAEGAVRGR
jgi:hypothetical protein